MVVTGWGVLAADVRDDASEALAPDLSNSAAGALDRAVAWLLEARSGGGWWRDFALAPGPSDEWVTAYVATTLAETASLPARAAARDAWELLRACHVRAGGWGYNAWTPCDADTTTWALQLADRLGVGDSERARRGRRFLARHLRGDGGVATYAEEAPIRAFTRIGPATSFAGWCGSHVCVTAAVAASPRYRSRLLEFLRANQRPDGRWRSYWWCDDEYATALAAAALAVAPERGDRGRVRRAVDWARERIPDGDGSAFATAWRLDLAGRAPHGDTAAWAAALAWLLDRQRGDGSWPPSARLRVPHPDVVDPDRSTDWVAGGRVDGAVVLDDQSIFTTATVVRALTGHGRDGRAP